MSLLLRAPEECASWEWGLDNFAPPGLHSALMTAAKMSALLREHELLEPTALEWNWFIHGTGAIGMTTSLPVNGWLDPVEIAQRIERSRPMGFPSADPGIFTVSGTGTWFDAEGLRHQEPGLLVLSVDADERHLVADVTVYHDIWNCFDFTGLPHPDVYKRNAPRLANAIRALESLLGTTASAGDATYFGRAEGYGLETPDMIDGRGPDLSDRL